MSPRDLSGKSLEGGRGSRAGGDRWRAAILWLALGLAFSPVLADLFRHQLTQPWSRYSLIFPVLFARCAQRERGARAARRDGLVLLGLGILIEIVTVGGGVIRFGRIGLILAAVGLCRSFGFASLRASVLMLWCVPLPHSLSAFASPQLEETLLDVSARIVALCGGDVVAQGRTALGPSGQLSLSQADGGPLLVALLSGIGWFSAARAGRDLAGCLRRAASWGVVALAVQAATVLLATTALALGASETFARALASFLWALPAGLGVLRAERRAGDSPPES